MSKELEESNNLFGSKPTRIDVLRLLVFHFEVVISQRGSGEDKR